MTVLKKKKGKVTPAEETKYSYNHLHAGHLDLFSPTAPPGILSALLSGDVSYKSTFTKFTNFSLKTAYPETVLLGKTGNGLFCFQRYTHRVHTVNS